MKVVLNQTVPKLGKQGQVVAVKDGYARNFLFPRGLAVVADKNQLRAVAMRQQRMEAKLAESKAGAEALKEKLDGQVLLIEGKVGEGSTKLFGAITAQDVADAIKTNLGVDLEKKQVGVLEPIKRLGAYAIDIDLHRDVDATVTVKVFDPNAPVDEPEAPAEAEVEAEPEAEPVA